MASIPDERIRRLFELAEERASKGKMELSDRYVEIAREIGMAHNVSIPGKWKKFCGGCESFLVPGRNCTVRVNSKKRNVNYRCGECGHVNRYGY